MPRTLENDEIVVTGTVHDLPQIRDDATRFEFVVDSSAADLIPDVEHCTDHYRRIERVLSAETGDGE